VKGEVILPINEVGYRVELPVVGPDQAMREVLAAYLGNLSFDSCGRSFRLVRVLDRWPTPDTQIAYPSASIVAEGRPVDDSESLVPRIIPNTWNGKSALWKIGEMTQSFQVDFWTDSFVDQSAIMSRMHGAFASGEMAHRVMLTGTDDYYGLPVRAAMRGIERIETPQSMFENEFRARMVVLTSIDVAELRCVTALRVNPALVLIGPNVDTKEEN